METLFFTQSYTVYDAINAFFLYSFLGWAWECVFIRITEGTWQNRGFVHAPFCIIYGFGGMLGYALLKPFSGNYIALYIAGALMATAFEYLTGRLMRRLFGTLWWNYEGKPFNYQGIICLESTLAWGIVAVLMFAVLQKTIFFIVMSIPDDRAFVLAMFLLIAYGIDFAVSARAAHARHGEVAEQTEEYTSLKG